MYYPCSENKGADQLRGNREADLRLWFGICRLLIFHEGAQILMILQICNCRLTCCIFIDLDRATMSASMACVGSEFCISCAFKISDARLVVSN